MATPAKAKRARSPATPVAPVKAPTVNVKSIAAQLAASNGLDKKQSEKLVADVVALIAGHLAASTSVTLAGLGTLAVHERDIRTGRNPATGEVIWIAGTKKLVFMPAKKLRDAI